MLLKQRRIEEMITSLQGLIRINSVGDLRTVTPEHPYGVGAFNALTYMKELALRDGFKVLDFDNHAIAIVLGEGEERIDVVCHLDVVSEGVGWTKDPFGGEIVDNKMFGRGTQDNKGPAMAAYTALKDIKEGLESKQFTLKRQLRVVLGCDEERTMDDIKHYIAKAGEPTFAFTPDGYFPLSIGEKGALMWTLKGKVFAGFDTLDGGVQCNVIAPTAQARFTSLIPEILIERLDRSKIPHTIETTPDGILVHVEGKAAHASRPELGDNATVKLLKLIATTTEEPLANLLHTVFRDPYGESADLSYTSKSMGKLTLNLGVLRINKGELYAEIDCRYPIECDSHDLTRRLQDRLIGLDLSLDYDAKPILNDENNPMIKLLLKRYAQWSKDATSRPIISGGVTYSKVIRNCVAFGPHRQDESSLAHQADECIDLHDLKKLVEVYAGAMLDLAGDDDE
ncbi:MAG: Sapep family Mn(2+)-dependent dipeptidase [Erysipelotrichaceae bacterium]